MFNVERINGISFNGDNPSYETERFEPEYQFFESPMEQAADNFTSSGGWTAALGQELTKLNVASYTWTPIKDQDDAITKSANHLMDLIRYYEGDPENNYRAKSSYNDRNRVRTYGYGIVSASGNVKNILVRNGVTLPPKNETEAYKAVIVYLREISAPEIRDNLKKSRIDFDTLPNSIKEGLLDLHFNKGISSISANRTLKNALKSQNWAEVLKQMVVVRASSGTAIDNPGLYRRSFSRIILASRDIPKTPEVEAVLKQVYNKAIASVEPFNRAQTDASKKVDKAGFTALMDRIFTEYKSGTGTVREQSAPSSNPQQQTFRPSAETSLYNLSMTAFPDGTKDVRVAFIQEVLRLNPSLKTGNGGLDNDGWPLCRKISAGESITIPEKIVVNNQTIRVNAGNVALAAVTEPAIAGQGGADDNTKTGEDVSNIERMMFEFGSENVSDSKIGAAAYNLACRDFIYTVERGDTLWRISNSYNIDLTTLKQYNGLTSNNINVGQKIIIPKIIYEIKRGDTLTSISRRLGLTIDVLKDLNSIDDVNKIQVGQTVEIPGYPYIVKRGDNLNKIAENAGVTLETLKALNGLRSDVIQPGQKLLIVFNNADYNETETVREASRINYYRAPVTGRSASVYPYYRHHYENGRTVATREVFAPTSRGSLNGKRIIINAGHGFTSAGHDPGARNRASKYDESEITYFNAMALSDKLRAQGATVVYIQGGVNLASAAISKETSSDMMISLHVNSSPAREVAHDRVEVFYNPRNCPKGKTLAEAIEKNIDKKHPRNREYASTSTANHSVTRARGNRVPAVLVELGFINNSTFRNSTNRQPVRTEIVNAIYQSVINYNF